MIRYSSYIIVSCSFISLTTYTANKEKNLTQLKLYALNKTTNQMVAGRLLPIETELTQQLSDFKTIDATELSVLDRAQLKNNQTMLASVLTLIRRFPPLVAQQETNSISTTLVTNALQKNLNQLPQQPLPITEKLTRQRILRAETILNSFNPDFIKDLKKVTSAARNKEGSNIPTLPPVIKKEIIQITDECTSEGLTTLEQAIQQEVALEQSTQPNNETAAAVTTSPTTSKGWFTWPWS